MPTEPDLFDPPPAEPGDAITLAHYAERAYLEYALSVVKGRALPDVTDGQKPVPRNSDLGGHHLAVYVDDLDAAVEYLRSRGVEVMGEPVASRNASEGQRWVYFRAPWGMQFELVSYPQGKAYEADAAVRLWHPGHPEA